MNIESKVKKDKLTLDIEGRIDTDTAPELEKFLKENIEGINSVVINFSKVEYVSSAGLRVLMWLRKQKKGMDSVVIKHMNSEVRTVFDLTGFSDMFTIK